MSGAAQTTGRVLMVRPAAFGPNAETAASNAFQQAPGSGDFATQARAEFDRVAGALRAAGVEVFVVEDTPEPVKPDAVFPNNWLSLHADGTVILYPMEAHNRRAERRREIVETLAREGFRISRVVDLSPLEREGRHLEGTGSVILDHAGGVAYAALSSRTDALAAAEFGRVSGLEVVTFATRDQSGRALYHANVMLTIGTAFAVVCPDVISDARERNAVVSRLEASGREVIAITPGMVRGFAANILELRGAGGEAVIAMSETARAALGPALVGRLERHGSIVAAPIPVIERIGGGSVRCMLAENFLPR